MRGFFYAKTVSFAISKISNIISFVRGFTKNPFSKECSKAFLWSDGSSDDVNKAFDDLFNS